MPLDCALLGADLIEAAGAAVAGPATRGESGTLLLHRVDELPAEVAGPVGRLAFRAAFGLAAGGHGGGAASGAVAAGQVPRRPGRSG